MSATVQKWAHDKVLGLGSCQRESVVAGGVLIESVFPEIGSLAAGMDAVKGSVPGICIAG